MSNELSAFIDGMYESLKNENAKLYELYKSLITESGIGDARDWEELYFAAYYPFENLMEGFISSKFSSDPDAVFIIANSQFLERHFKAIITQQEGSPCSADKSSTIMDALIRFYTTGNKIEFDYSGEYTFQLPKKVFKTHEQIISFYKGLKGLFYGSHKHYLDALKEIYNEEAQ